MKALAKNRPHDKADTVVITPEDIRSIVAKIIKGVNPEKIIMFGSRAHGNENDFSDLDILVVMNTNKSKWHRSGDIYMLTMGRGFPMDVIVYTPEEFKEAVEHEDYWFNPLIKDIINEGVVLYD